MSTNYRDPVFNLSTLTNSDTVLTWLTRTNEIIQGMNSLYVVDVFEGDGICTTRVDGIVTVNVDPGPGIGFTVDNKVTLNLTAIPVLSSVSPINSPVSTTDYVLIEKSGVVKKVKAEALLPATLKHNHTFSGTINLDNDLKIKNTISAGSVGSAKIQFGEYSSIAHEFQSSVFYIDTGTLCLGGGNNTAQRYPIISRAHVGNIGEVSAKESLFDFATSTYAPIGFGSSIQFDSITFNFHVGTAPQYWYGNHVGTWTFAGNQNQIWPATWKMKFNENTAGFYYFSPNHTTTDTSDDYTQSILTMVPENSISSTVTISDKIYITNIENSAQFISTPTGSQYKVPLTNSVGVLDKKFTNRIITNDFTITPSVGQLMAVSTFTNGDSYYIRAIANGIGSSDVIGIVESLSGGKATIVLSGEFELSTVNTLDPGHKYYLSQSNPGGYVKEGVLTSGIMKPVFVATTGSKGILLPASSANANNIGSITVNYGTASSETLEIDSPNFPLKLIAGQNIKFDVTTNNEISVRVDGLAGAQDTFKNITAGGNTVVADSPTDTLTLTSSSLTITSNVSTDTINFEIPNTFKFFKFTSNSTNFIQTPDSTADTLQLIAGTGISFSQNTDDSIIINASLTGAVSPSTFTYSGPYQIPTSNSSNAAGTVDLVGGSSGKFDAVWSSVNGITAPVLTAGSTISYSSGTNRYTYNSTSYNNDSSYVSQNVDNKYLPDELAGFMFGRITPSGVGSSTSPSNTISRLTRRDVRFFLGLAPTGYIDSVNSVYNRWTIDNGSNFVTAGTKEGILNIVAGTGILLENDSNRIKITNTGVSQNSFSHVRIKTKTGTTLDSFDADSSGDTFSLRSGNFVTITSDTNNDTATFDISVPYDYALLGNAGTTDGMGIIDLSGSSSCLVGRAGGSVRSITSADLAWTGSGATRTAPTLALPNFGLIKVNAPSIQVNPLYLNASTTGTLTITEGTGVTFGVVEGTNTITINSLGTTGSPGTTPSIKQILVNDQTFNVGASFDQLKLITGSGVDVSTQGVNSNILPVTFNLAAIAGDCILANTTSSGAIPLAFNVTEGSVLGRLTSGRLTNLSINTDIKTALDIKYTKGVKVYNSSTSTPVGLVTNDSLSGNYLVLETVDNSIQLGFLNSNGSRSGVDAITIKAIPALILDKGPIFYSIAPETSGNVNTTIKYGGIPLASSNAKFSVIQHLNAIGTGVTGNENAYVLSKELYNSNITITANSANLFTVTPVSGRNSAKYLAGQSITEFIYADNYTMSIADWNGSAWITGDLTIESDVLNLSATADISLTSGGANTKFSVGSRYIKSTDQKSTISANMTYHKLWTQTFGSGAIISAWGSNGGTTTLDTLNFLSKDSTRFNFLENGTSFLQINRDSANTVATDLQITSSGTIRFDAPIKFTSGKTVDFTGALVSGLSTPVHASTTHRSAQSEASNGSVSFTDMISAWQVGAVARNKPVLRNLLAITNGDSNFDYTSFSTTQLFGASGGVASTYSTIFGSANSAVGPMYVVLGKGEESNLTVNESKGPAGQIIMIRKT